MQNTIPGSEPEIDDRAGRATFLWTRYYKQVLTAGPATAPQHAGPQPAAPAGQSRALPVTERDERCWLSSANCLAGRGVPKPPRPCATNRIVASWNGLTIAALARAAVKVFENRMDPGRRSRHSDAVARTLGGGAR